MGYTVGGPDFPSCHCQPLHPSLHHYSMRLLRHEVPRNDREGIIAPFFVVIASPFLPVIASEAWQSQENQILNPKSEILNNVK